MVAPRPLVAGAALAALAAACGDSADRGGDAVALENQAAAAPSVPAASPQEMNVDDPTAGDSAQAEGNRSRPGAGDDSMRWNFSRTAAGPTLAFGEPQTDNVRLMLRCGRGQVTLHFMRSAEFVGRRPDHLTVASGGMQSRSEVSAKASELGGMSVTATAPLASAPLTAFRSGKPLEVRWGDETIAVPGQAGAAVGQFFEACGD